MPAYVPSGDFVPDLVVGSLGEAESVVGIPWEVSSLAEPTVTDHTMVYGNNSHNNRFGPEPEPLAQARDSNTN